MYKCLLVDDDLSICQGLPLLIDWEKYGYSIADTAQNGEQALALIRKSNYDLLITDIRMPKLDGIGLIKQMAEEDIQINTIILSGYRDFEYARKAVELGVKNYILKPVNEDLLIEILQNLKVKMDESCRFNESIKESQSILIERIWADLLSEGQLSEKARDNLEKSGTNYTDNSFRVIVIEPDSAHMNRLLRYLQKAIQTNPTSEVSVKIAHLEKNRYALVVCSSLKADLSPKEYAEKLSERILFEFDSHIKIAIGSQAGKLEDLAKSYQDACLLFDVNDFSYHDGIVIYDEVKMNRIIAPILEYIRANCQDKLSLRSIAVRYYLNPAYLGRLFTQHTGIVFNEFLINCRIELAQKYLASNKYMIAEIAEKVGYNDSDHFCRIFKQKTGITPREYRSKYTREN